MGNSKSLDLLRQAFTKFDSYKNVLKGLNTTRDPMTHSEFVAEKLSDTELDNLYHGDDMAARSCDTVPEEMLRRGFTVKSSDMDSDDLKKINDALIDLDVKSKFVDAATWARVFGGCVVYIGADDGAKGPALAEPLRVDSIKKLDHLNVIDKRHALPEKWYTDPSERKYGQPETYTINSDGSGGNVSVAPHEVHETRLIRFDGLRCSATYRQLNNGWGLSLLNRMHKILRSFDLSFQSLGNLMIDANQGIFKMKDYFEAIATNNLQLIQNRFMTMDIGRSDIRSVVLDADKEDFQRQNFNWSGIKEPYTLLMLRLAAAAKQPVTVLMGQSPAGMDATGESDIRWFYDQTESHRSFYLDPKLKQLIRLVTLAKDGPTGGKELEEYTINYPSLWQPTQKEDAEIKELLSWADKNYAEIGVLTPDEIALSRFTRDGWSAETEIDIEMHEDLLEQTKQQPNEPVTAPNPIKTEEAVTE